MLPEPTIVKISVRIYRLFVRLYPPSFRQKYGDGMTQCFRDASRDAFQASGWMGLCGVLVAGVADHVQSIAREQGESLVITGRVKNLSRAMPVCWAGLGALALGLWVATLDDSIGLFSLSRNTSLRFTRGVMEFRLIDAHSFEPPLSREEFHETAQRREWFVPKEPAFPLFAFSSGHGIGIGVGPAGADGDAPTIAPARYSLLRVPLWVLLIPMAVWCGSILKRHGVKCFSSA
jgi:hypothetical protein